MPRRRFIRWTPEEDAILRAQFETEDDTAIAKRLTGRTPAAIATRRKVLGLTKPQNPVKITPRMHTMIALYADYGKTHAEIAALIGISERSVTWSLNR